MLGDKRPTAGQRAFVSGLLGSAGTGSTGMSVADMTPIGGLLSAQENAQRGDYKGTALAMLPMPGAKLGNAVQRAAEEAAPAVERGIVAYHGSPHSFDRFDMSKIGTGEGAQAYGHGLYFADSEGVAKSYRDALKPGYFNNVLTIDGQDFGSDMGNYYLRNAVERAVPSPGAGFTSGKETFDFYNKEMSDAVYKALLKAETGHDVNKVASSTVDAVLQKHAPYEDEAAAVDEIRRALLGHVQNNVTTRPNGSMYQVRINADPEHFLDWDKPLSEQPVVRDKLMRYVFPDTAPTATSAVEARGGASIANPPTVRNSSATAGVDNAGISVARAADGPTLFNDYTFGAVRTQDGFHPRVETPNGQRIYRDVTLPSRAEAEAAGRSRVLETVARPQNAAESQFLNAAGIPGIKYLDQGSRGAGEGSRNYVVFDDSLIEILKKYGLIGLLGGGAAMNAAGQQQPEM